MINRITEIYIDSFIRYINCVPKNQYREQAMSVLPKIETANTLEALEEIIKSSGIPINHKPTAPQLLIVTAQASPSRISFFEEGIDEEPPFVDPLITIMIGIQNEINLRRHLRNKCCVDIQCDEQGAPLLNLIQKILDKPESFIHFEIVSFMSYLQNADSLQNQVKHLQSIPLIPRPSEPRRGSFDYKLYDCRDPDVMGCLTLLRSNAQLISNYNTTLSEEIDPSLTDMTLANEANLLLQKLLTIYHDLQIVPLSRVDSIARIIDRNVRSPRRCAIQ